MKILKIGLLAAIFAVLGANFAPVASAQYYYGRTPYLTVSGQSGSTQTFSVSNADPNSRVILYARNTGGTLWSTSIDSIGQTDGSGYLNTSLNPGISGSAEFKVTVNGADSNIAQSGYGGCGYQGCGGCTYNCGTPYGFSLSQSTVYLTAGQSVAVTAYNTYGTSLYVSSNSNSSVASYTLSGNQITVYGIASGSTTINVCASGSGAACASLYVTVSGSSYGGNVWFSPSNPSMYVGQSLAVSINSSAYATGLYGSTSYYINSNSNSSVATASVSGTVLNLYAYQVGTTTISICHNSLNYCGSLYVTVTGGSYTGNLSFSQSSINLSIGQTQSITAYGSYSGSLFVSTNSNSNVVSPTISGNQINFYGLTNGSSNVVICANSGYQCGTVYVTVSGGGSGAVTFSQNNLNLYNGQTATVSVYTTTGLNNFYLQGNTNSGVVSSSLSGSSLYLTALSGGNSTITVCQTGNPNCAILYVTVNGGSGTGTGVWFSQSNVSLNAGQSQMVTIYGSNYSNNYNIASNVNAYAVSANIVGNILNLNGLQSGNTTIVVCQQNTGICGSIYVTVNGGSSYGSLYFTTTTLPNMVLGQYYSYQLQVSGGSYPYNFQVISGQLPSGLYMNTSGLIYGTPQNSSATSFAVKANDNYGRTATANFNIGGGGVLGASIYASGQLIKENGTVFLVYRNQKSGFSSAAVFTNFGFKFSNVLTTGFTGIPDSGYIINNSNTSHPWGAWIQSGSTIYFVHQDGLIPVPSWDVFINNRGQSSFIVQANIYDFQRAILSPMVNNDSRLY